MNQRRPHTYDELSELTRAQARNAAVRHYQELMAGEAERLRRYVQTADNYILRQERGEWEAPYW